MFYIDLFWMINGHFLHIALGSVDAGLFALGVLLLEIPTIYIINKFFPILVGQKKRKNT